MLSNVMFYLITSQKVGCWDWWNLQKNMREFKIKVPVGFCNNGNHSLIFKIGKSKFEV